jgi:hypothetical protein
VRLSSPIALLLMACGPEMVPCPALSVYAMQLANDSGYDCATITHGLEVVWEVGQEQGFATSHEMRMDREGDLLILTDGAFSCAEVKNAGGCANADMVKVRTYGETGPLQDIAWAHEWAHWMMHNYVTTEDNHSHPRFLAFVAEVNNRL